MRKCSWHFKPAVVLTFLVVVSPLFLSVVSAQQLRMYDFVLFGSNSSQLGSSITVNGGSVGSYSLVQSSGTAAVKGNLYSKGRVVLTNSNTINGNIAAANLNGQTGNIVQTGSKLYVGGDIDARGNVYVSGGTIRGKVRLGSTANSYVGPTPGGGPVTKGNAIIPDFPQLPAIKNYTGTTAVDIKATAKISKGTYGNVILTGGQTLTLTDTGSYYFNSFSLANANTIVFDFGNKPGYIRIYVAGNMLLDKISTSIINGGDAGRIFTETDGKGSIAFKIANGSGNTKCRWSGTVWAPYGSIDVGAGTGSSEITGALWSGIQVNLQSGVTVNYSPYTEVGCTPPTVNAGEDKPLSFSETTPLTGTTNAASPIYSWAAINGGSILPPANTASINVTAAGTYILTVKAGGCSASDSVVVTNKVPNLIGSEDYMLITY